MCFHILLLPLKKSYWMDLQELLEVSETTTWSVGQSLNSAEVETGTTFTLLDVSLILMMC